MATRIANFDYQTYLASREWALKREQVRERSENRCEHCQVNPQQAVHHLTYARIGHENLDDLMAVCDACHEWFSGKRQVNPLSEAFYISEVLRGDNSKKAVHLAYQILPQERYSIYEWQDGHPYYIACWPQDQLGKCRWCDAHPAFLREGLLTVDDFFYVVYVEPLLAKLRERKK